MRTCSVQGCRVNVVQRGLALVGFCACVQLLRRFKSLAQQAKVLAYTMQTLHEIRDTDKYTIVWRPGQRSLDGSEFEISWGEIFQPNPDWSQGLQDGCPASFPGEKEAGTPRWPPTPSMRPRSNIGRAALLPSHYVGLVCIKVSFTFYKKMSLLQIWRWMQLMTIF